MRKNDLIQIVGEINRIELVNRSEDRWPLLACRKKFRRVAIMINCFALKIIKRKSFEAIIIIIIICNCITLTMNKAD